MLLALSAAFFVGSFISGSFLLEVSSLTSFVLAVLLLVSGFEQQVKIYPSAAAIEGPTVEVASLLKEKGWDGPVAFVPGKEGVKMRLKTSSPVDPLETRPLGEGLFELYESECGALGGKGFDYVAEWLPRAMVDALSLAGSVSMSGDNGAVTTRIAMPFVRPLCVKPYFTENICKTMGCPLVSSVGQALASGMDREVVHGGCTYDPRTQTAVAVHKPVGGPSLD
jgi:hypothetical protein